MTQAAGSACPPQSCLSLVVGFFIILSHALEYRLTTLVIVSLDIRTFACNPSSITAFSVQLICAQIARVHPRRPKRGAQRGTKLWDVTTPFAKLLNGPEGQQESQVSEWRLCQLRKRREDGVRQDHSGIGLVCSSDPSGPHSCPPLQGSCAGQSRRIYQDITPGDGLASH